MAEIPPAPSDPLLGRTVGPCRVEALLGRGGMGAVYRARHIPLDRQVALKVIAPDWLGSPAASEAFLNEARTAARLEDPRIVQVYDVGQEGGLTYIVMQLLSGLTLEAKVARDGPLSQEEALRIIKEITQGLVAAHGRGVVHRDIKPGNVMLGPDGSVRIMDFGLSAAAGKPAAPQEGLSSVGSFDFMAPEQGFGAPPDARMDLYALGATYFYALTGQAPYSAGSSGDVLLQHRDAAIPDVRELRREVTEAAAGLIRKLMAKDPAQRPASAEALLRELNSHRMLLDVDASGSPFTILPPPVEAKTGFDPSAGFAALAPEAAPDAPPAPMPAAPPPAPAVRRSPFVAKLIACCVFAAVFARSFSRAGRPDWAAAGIFAMALEAFVLSRVQWRALLRIPAGILAAAAALAAFYAYGVGGFVLPAAWPDLEVLVLAGLGLAAAGSALYLGLAEAGGLDRLMALGLLVAACALLLAAACSLRLPVEAALLVKVRAILRSDWEAFLASGGAWRWCGVLALCLAWLLLRRARRAQADKGPILNWNR